jgi:hypothetical protein
MSKRAADAPATRGKTKRSRTESRYAHRRRSVSLAMLTHATLLRPNDIVLFTYKARTFSARITHDACIAAPGDAVHARAHGLRDGAALYDRPTNWALDCCARAWREVAPGGAPRRCATNPSGWQRVRLQRTGKSLSDLRDDYMQRFAHQLPGGRAGDDEHDAIDDDDDDDADDDADEEVEEAEAADQAPAAAPRPPTPPARPPTPREHVEDVVVAAARVDARAGIAQEPLSPNARILTVSEAQEQLRTKGYKPVAYLFERELNSAMDEINALRRANAVYEGIIEALCDAHDILYGSARDTAASARAKHILSIVREARAHCEARQRSDNAAAAASAPADVLDDDYLDLYSLAFASGDAAASGGSSSSSSSIPSGRVRTAAEVGALLCDSLS